MLKQLCAAALLALAVCGAAFSQGQVAFRIPERDFVPEGIAHDPRSGRFFVGSTFKRKVVAVDRRGAVTEFTAEGQDELFGALGMRVDARRRELWIVSSNAGRTMPSRGLARDCLGCSYVHRYDLRTGRLVKKYLLGNKPAQHFLNDLVVTPAGDVFVTDTVTGDLYTIPRRTDELEVFLSLGRESYPNGLDLSPDGRRLFVAVNGALVAVDLAGRKSVRLAMPAGEKAGGIDGLYFYKNSLVAIQPFDAKRQVVRYLLNKAQDAVTKVEVLEAENPLQSQPTTGVIVGRDFYYVANSQLQVFRRLYQPDGTYDREKLSDIVVLKLRLPAR